MLETYIGLGSNLENPINQILIALQELKKLPNSKLKSVSSLYESPPLDNTKQPNYINVVAKLNTNLKPQELLRECQNIENKQGRLRAEKWGARIIDLDILLYGDKIINADILTIPHYDIKNRAFVLVPLYEIAPELIIPNLGKLKNLVTNCNKKSLIKIN